MGVHREEDSITGLLRSSSQRTPPRYQRPSCEWFTGHLCRRSRYLFRVTGSSEKSEQNFWRIIIILGLYFEQMMIFYNKTTKEIPYMAAYKEFSLLFCYRKSSFARNIGLN